MLSRTVALLTTFVFLAVIGSPAQAKPDHTDNLVARLSYQRAYAINLQKVEQLSPRICFALYRSGYYRISKLTVSGEESLQGTLSEAQLVSLRKMLNELDLKTSNGGGIVLQGSESFLAELVSDQKTVDHLWFDPDHQRPFPASVASLVNWLESFKPVGASPLSLREMSEQPVCPPASAKPLQSVAANVNAQPAGGCEGR